MLGHWQIVQTQIRGRRTWHLIKMYIVCSNNGKLKVKWNRLKSPFGTIFPAYTQKQSTHRCCQGFDLSCVSACCITKTRLFRYIEKIITKNCKFSDKNSDIFHFSARNIDCGYALEPPHRGGSNKYPQSMFLSRNKKNNVYPCKPQFYYKKWGLRGSKLYRHVFLMASGYEGPAKSFVTWFGLLQCYVLSNIFLLQTFKVFPLYWNTCL